MTSSVFPRKSKAAMRILENSAPRAINTYQSIAQTYRYYPTVDLTSSGFSGAPGDIPAFFAVQPGDSGPSSLGYTSPLPFPRHQQLLASPYVGTISSGLSGLSALQLQGYPLHDSFLSPDDGGIMAPNFPSSFDPSAHGIDSSCFETFPPQDVSQMDCDVAENSLGLNEPYQLPVSARASKNARAQRSTSKGDQPRSFHCDYPSSKRSSDGMPCGQSFAQNKDLIRHVRSVHCKDGDPVYRCRCGTVGVRKDNYLRHVHRCSRDPRWPVYSCKCGDTHAEKEYHVSHVEDCAKCYARRGRPPGPR